MYPTRFVGGVKIIADPNGDGDGSLSVVNVSTDSITPVSGLDIKGDIHAIHGIVVGNGTPLTAPGIAPSFVNGASGSLTSSVVYKYAYTFVQADGGESASSPIASFGPLATTGYEFSLNVSVDASVSTRKIYRSTGGGSVLYYLTSINNVDATYTDIANDSALNTSIIVPTTDSSTPATVFDASGAMTSYHNVLVRNVGTVVSIADQSIVSGGGGGSLTNGTYYQQITAGVNGYAYSFSLNGQSTSGSVVVTVTLVRGAVTSIPGGTWPTTSITFNVLPTLYTGTFGATDMYMAAGQQYTFVWTISTNVVVFNTTTSYSGGLPVNPFICSTSVYATQYVAMIDASNNRLALYGNVNQLAFTPANNTAGATLYLSARPSTSRTLTLPDATDTIAVLSLAQTMLNKTITSPSLTLGGGTAITGYFTGTITVSWVINATSVATGVVIRYAYTNLRCTITIPRITATFSSSTGFLTSDALPSYLHPNATIYSNAGPVTVGIANNSASRIVIDVSNSSYKIFIEPIAGGTWTSLTSITWDSFEMSYWL